ncbi:MAG: hypothetical protein ACXVA9_05725 [Bdellovibrionales bacterium]
MSTAISSSEIEQLFNLEDELNECAGKFGLELKSSPASLAPKMRFLLASKAQSVAANLTNLIQNLDTCWDDGIDPWNDREFFLLSMRSMELTFPKDFLNHLSEGDLIEGYDMNRVQTFRNMRFMELSTYSLLEVQSAEWTALYERPPEITEKMISFCDELLWQANRTIPFNIPVHFIRELRSEDKRIFEIKFKYLTPLFSGPNQPYGMLGSSKVEVIRGAKSGDNVAFN